MRGYSVPWAGEVGGAFGSLRMLYSVLSGCQFGVISHVVRWVIAH